MRRNSAAFQINQLCGSLAILLAALAHGEDLRATEIALPPLDDPDPVASSEHFDLGYPASQEPWVKQTLDTLEQWRKELGAHAEILPPRVRIESSASVGEFIHATGQPGWMAASSDGQSIVLQPLELLARKRILNQTLRHELTHLAVHRLRAKEVPRWFEEGLVLYLTEERIEAPPAAPRTASELEEAISKPRSETEMKTAYAHALERVQRLARRQGDAALWRVLEHPSADDLRWLHSPRGKRSRYPRPLRGEGLTEEAG